MVRFYVFIYQKSIYRFRVISINCTVRLTLSYSTFKTMKFTCVFVPANVSMQVRVSCFTTIKHLISYAPNPFTLLFSLFFFHASACSLLLLLCRVCVLVSYGALCNSSLWFLPLSYDECSSNKSTIISEHLLVIFSYYIVVILDDWCKNCPNTNKRNRCALRVIFDNLNFQMFLKSE